ncbi:YcfL family protein [Undibacterium oligocarboniphilum]|uniref:YcfL family protein n=1 Tax=Undibacterium oligocarboniphilum TaxID=666702 RepID=A0A850QBU1_9BURK|nr:YcfL family protein [Undibacterium oligocarboniphilum]MBC3871120.1 YcfL family protein [Undibacterium oligocarboniphilum]NVO76257.1 YcfL family protein [Undibacterium oligocarboniphilum]
MKNARLFAASALFAACWITSAQAANDIPNASSAGIAAKLMVRGTLEGVQVVDLRSQRRNDVMVVQAEMQNLTDKDVRVYYRFRWTDAAGMQVGDGEVWKPLMILGRQSQLIKGTAYGPQANDFKIEISAEPR